MVPPAVRSEGNGLGLALVRENELVARVRPNTIVEESTLRVHAAGLRKALNDGKDGARFIENVTGLGYRFVAPIASSRNSWPAAQVVPGNSDDPRELQRLREENARLRNVVADLSIHKRILEEKIGRTPFNGAGRALYSQ